MSRRVPYFALAGLLALAVLVVGHNVVFLLTYGSDFGAALLRTGHGSRWDETVRAVLVAEGLLAIAATMRLAYLYRLVRRLGRSGAGGGLSARSYVRALLPLWLGLFAASTVLFVLLENFEHWSAGLSLPGLGVLRAPDLAGPIPVFVVVSLLVAAVAALFRWGVATLEARIAASRPPARTRFSTPQPRLTADGDRPATSILGRNLAGRAPPTPTPA